MVKKLILNSRSEWLKARSERIGGSDAAALVGMNPYKTNVELWEEKTGRTEVQEISDNEFIEYGRNTEKYQRELFKLDYPQYEVEYEENNLFLNDKYPFGHASLDGWLYDEQGRLGILEIKTTTIQNAAQKLKWKDRIPDNYYCQVCWYLGIMDAEYAILRAQLKWEKDEDVLLVTKHYKIERSEVQDDIDLLMKRGEEFFECVRSGTRPPLILPEI